MNGIHDMGGLHGFGPVEVEVDEPVFHTRWGARVYAMTQVIDTTGVWNLDEHRHEIELMTPQAYILDGYYGRWLFAMESILTRKNILDKAEIDRRVADIEAGAETTPVTTPAATPATKTGRNWPLTEDQKIRWGAWRHEKDAEIVPRFAVGDRVRVRNLHPEGHTRLTSYIRGKTGEVAIVNAQAWVLPDTRAHNAGENLQPVYNVAFPASEVWGPQAEANVMVNVDLMEDYLELAESA
ncbi:MAG: nitrile hydratase subunit beta [Pseudomonadota bacterium]